MEGRVFPIQLCSFSTKSPFGFPCFLNKLRGVDHFWLEYRVRHKSVNTRVRHKSVNTRWGISRLTTGWGISRLTPGWGISRLTPRWGISRLTPLYPTNDLSYAPGSQNIVVGSKAVWNAWHGYHGRQLEGRHFECRHLGSNFGILNGKWGMWYVI